MGVVHCGEFTGAPVRAWCASWKVIGGLREFVLVTRPFFRSLRNPSADLICSECWFFICIAHLEAGGAGFLLCFGALVWEGVQSLSTKKVSGASRARVVQILRPALGTFGSRMVLPLGRGAQKKLAERPVREWCKF